MNKHKKDELKVAKRENYFSTLAKKEAQDAILRARSEKKRGLSESAKDSRREAKIADEFARVRHKWAAQAKKKAGK